MSLFTSSHFASACASGSDWRDTSKAVLEKLEDVRDKQETFNFGILYVSDHLADDSVSILNLFKSVLKIDLWVGSVGMGVIGCNEVYFDTPAISAMLCQFPKDSFCPFPELDNNGEVKPSQDNLEKWMNEKMPFMALVHGDPMAEQDPRVALSEIERLTNSYLLGGLGWSRSHQYQFAEHIFNNQICGAFLSSDIDVATTVSQGCEQISALHTITKADENTILEIDDQNALKVFQNDLRELASKKMGKDPEEFFGDIQMIENSDRIPPEFKNLFKGDVHVAFLSSQSDTNDYVVRDIMNIDADEGSITVSEQALPGDTIIFVERNAENIETDLTKSLIALQKRVTSERGSFAPKGAVYISCVARGMGKPSKPENHEIKIIHSIIGDIPMTGFYGGGEISNARIYGYTGILTLFF